MLHSSQGAFYERGSFIQGFPHSSCENGIIQYLFSHLPWDITFIDINPSFYSLTLVTAHTRTLQSYKRHIPKGYRFSFFSCQTALEERLDFILRKIDSKVPFFDQILSCNFYLPWKSFILKNLCRMLDKIKIDVELQTKWPFCPFFWPNHSSLVQSWI